MVTGERQQEQERESERERESGSSGGRETKEATRNKWKQAREKVENQASNISRACIYHTINIKIDNVTKRAAHKPTLHR